MMRFAVAGNVLTEDGVMLQLPTPYVAGQLRLTAPLKPSCEAIEIGPLTPVLPTLTLGKGVNSLSTKSGFIITLIVNDEDDVDAPCVAACSVTV
jgi:hypothetical protein